MSRPAFTVIKGGLAAPTAPAPAEELPLAKGGPAEAAQLARAILALRVQDAGLTVEQCLDEISATMDGDAREEPRNWVLQGMLQDMGLLVRPSDPQEGLRRDCYLSLLLWKTLLEQHPELAHLNPAAHEFMTFG